MSINTFPTTIIYNWETKTPLEDVINITNGLSMASSFSTNWEIEILLKFAKQKQSSIVQNRGKGDTSSASYFVRQPDIDVCCVVVSNKEKTIYDDIFVGTDADALQKFQNFTQRSLWFVLS